MNKEDYKQFHYLLAEYKWQVLHELKNPNLKDETIFQNLMMAIELLLENVPIEYEIRYYEVAYEKEVKEAENE